MQPQNRTRRFVERAETGGGHQPGSHSGHERSGRVSVPTERPVEKGIERGAVALDIVQYSHARVWQMKMSASIVRLSSANTACFQMLAFRTYRALTVGFTVEKKKKKVRVYCVFGGTKHYRSQKGFVPPPPHRRRTRPLKRRPDLTCPSLNVNFGDDTPSL